MRSQYHFSELSSTGIAVQRATEMCRLSEEKCTTLRGAFPLGLLGFLDELWNDNCDHEK